MQLQRSTMPRHLTAPEFVVLLTAGLFALPGTGCGWAATCDAAGHPECFAWNTMAASMAAPGQTGTEAGWERWIDYCRLLGEGSADCIETEMFNVPGTPKRFIRSREPQRRTRTAPNGVRPDEEQSEERSRDILIYYNPAAARGIKAAGLESIDSLESRYSSDLKNGSTQPEFDSDAVVIKSKWEPAGGTCDGARYRCVQVTGAGGVLVWYRLVAFHMASKALKNWLWATWEHNTLTGHDIKADPYGRDAKGKPTWALRQLMTNDRVDPVWLNYQLVVVQTDYKSPECAANASIEVGSTHDSCITCHARAAYSRGNDTLAQADKDGLGYVGTPCQSWYQDPRTCQTAYVRTQFLWSPLREFGSSDTRPSCVCPPAASAQAPRHH